MCGIRSVIALFSIAASILLATGESCGQTESDGPPISPRFNLPLWTFGGMQFWTDVVHRHGWRIQQHAVSGHYRLIDSRNIRRAWGSFEDCQLQLTAVEEPSAPPPSGPIVILLHGLGRSRNSMDPLASHLREALDCDVINVSYASTRASLDQHARALQSVIDHLPPETPIVVVAHSMGSLVLRRYLHLVEIERQGAPAESRIGRIVMLGPPNQGAALAAKLNELRLFGIVMGDSAQQLADLSDSVFPLELATPSSEFGIIAGNWNLGPLTNPLLDEQNDLFVSVEETRLPGASDFAIVEAAHGWLLTDAGVHKMVASFLENGYFYSPERRQPIAPDENDGGQD
jgi:pimeloyl-ACP methyl ester carboxylesterase